MLLLILQPLKADVTDIERARERIAQGIIFNIIIFGFGFEFGFDIDKPKRNQS